jgi:penicillin-binding protein 1A
MTGGSVPAMVWQRAMAYAHQRVELKPIPGIDKPFLDTAPDAVVAETDDETSEAARPSVLSPRTTTLLHAFSQAFQQAPALEPPAPEALSSL